MSKKPHEIPSNFEVYLCDLAPCLNTDPYDYRVMGIRVRFLAEQHLLEWTGSYIWLRYLEKMIDELYKISDAPQLLTLKLHDFIVQKPSQLESLIMNDRSDDFKVTLRFNDEADEELLSILETSAFLIGERA